KQAPVPIYSPLTGAKVDDVTLTTRPITAIMIENSPDARPQSGVKQAGIVYEAIAEGGITRFLALYQEAQPGLVGPVRSLRMYFLDWATPYNPGIVHVGGSAAALSEVRNGNYNDLDQFFNGSAFWRSTDRYAPHNVYTSFDNLNKLEQSKGITSSTFVGFLRADGKPSDAPDATSVDINFSGPLYNTHYDYDTASNTYLRNVGGVASMDREDGQISPSVVIAMKVDMSLILQDGYREAITTTGSGVADIFQNGAVIEATWKKDGRTAPLQFFDASGNEISLNRGQTWIAAVPNGSGSVSWQ
ncbi:MAG: DUF3048 domain-containing protein, partial [Candidatus Saccharimonas sp.]